MLELVGSRRRGHFALESGHHGDLWLDLDGLFLRASRIRPQVVELAGALRGHRPDAVCGPLTGGAFLAQLVAAELDVDFCPADRLVAADGVGYRVPGPLRPGLNGRRIAVVDDVINAGSAVRKTLVDLSGCGAEPVVLGALLVLGDSAAALAAEHGMAQVFLATTAATLWRPRECPMCAAGVPLTPAGDRSR
ncbi:MAG: orotate phosphoribosyltransferase [Kutzneria sp.]|nr:orotate phosphoribosyltransferase [Kutzneria sp.]MBV9844270.1 orotate phosphoribosyltransferase [Kutzneria sp.]